MNLLKKALGEDRPLIGVWCSLASPPCVELLGQGGFDWLMLDMEHAPLELDGLRECLLALNGSTTAPVVRARWNDPVEIKRILDLGVENLMIPFVQNAEEARAAVAATRYPPEGVRGVAGHTRATRYGRDKDYIRRANQEMCVLVQAESRAALAALPAIAAVPGVDGVFIGPGDLAANLGHPGNVAHPEVQVAIAAALDTIRAAGKVAGIIATEEDAARRMLALGFRFVAVDTDMGLLADAADRLAARFTSRSITPAGS